MCLVLLYMIAMSEMILEAIGTAREAASHTARTNGFEDLDLRDRRTRGWKMVNMAGTVPRLIIRAFKMGRLWGNLQYRRK